MILSRNCLCGPSGRRLRAVNVPYGIGKPIVALEASGREVAELCKEEWFRAELSALNSNGEPICGTGKEIAKYRQGSKEAEDSDDLLFVYLIDLDGA